MVRDDVASAVGEAPAVVPAPANAPRPGRVESRASVPPPLAVEVERPAIDALLEVAAQRRLAIVSAGPGWGKTTVVASWVRRSRVRSGLPTAWLSLDPGDDDPAVFWDAVLEAVDRSGAVPTGHSLAMATAAAGVTSEVLATVLRGLGNLPEPLLLVLDDFQVIANKEILAGLSELVAHETPVRLMLLTRFDPGLPLHRLRVAGDLAEVGAADLAFDAAAVIELARGAESLELSSAQVERLLDRTEGWPAGVRLAALYLSREPSDPDLNAFGGTDRSVAEFLVAEVLERHDSGTREFLERTSIVERLSGELADAIAPGGGGLAQLEVLEHANHFVVCVDAERTYYRYHPLLRDLLLHSLRRDDPEGCRDAHRAAARWLVTHGDPVGALHHAIEAEDWVLVAETFYDSAPSLVGVQRFAIRQQLQTIPYATLPPSASIELCAAASGLVAGDLEALEAHVEMARGHVALGDALSPLGAALLENLSAAAARRRGDVAATVTASTTALTHLASARPGPTTDALRTITLSQRAISLLWTGDTAGPRDTLATLMDADDGESVPLTAMSVRGNLAWCALLEGNLDQAEEGARDVLRAASARGWTSLLQVRPAYLALAISQSLRGYSDQADRMAVAGLAAQVGGEELWPTVALHLAQASIAVSRRRPQAAHAALAKAFANASNTAVPAGLVDTIARVQTEVTLLTVEPARSETTPQSGSEARSPTWWSSRARLELARDEVDSAYAAASMVPRPPESHRLDDTLAAIEAWLVLSQVAQRRGNRRQALHCAQSAAELASTQHLVRPFLLIGDVPKAELTQTLAMGGVVQAEFLTTIASGPNLHAPHPPEPAILNDQLTDRELAVLAELPSMRTNAEIASELYISTNTVKSHLRHLFGKLDVPNRRGAVRRARELGLID